MKNFKNFTELENSFLNAIINTWGDTGCDNTYLSDVCYDSNMTTKIARGIVSSLIKKGVVSECLSEYGFEINLTKQGHELLEIDCYWK